MREFQFRVSFNDRDFHAIFILRSNDVLFQSFYFESKARAGKVAEAIAFGEVIVLSLPMRAFTKLDTEAKQALKGKIVIDTSNPYPERLEIT